MAAKRWKKVGHASSWWLRGALVPAMMVAGWSLLPGAAGASSTSPSASPSSPSATPSAAGQTTCALGPGGGIKHVIYIQFDNTHFTPDNKTVASDIAQMPALYNFITGNGTVLVNDHTPLIAHTADDLVTSLTGVYGNDQGIPEANTYRYYNPTGTSSTAGSFSYWTDPVDSYATATGRATADRTPNMIDATGKMAPAPWVPFTRAGCTVGDAGLANMDIENLVPDIPNVFGWTSPQGQAALSAAASTSTTPTFVAGYEGLSVHCALGAAFCADNPNPVTDLLPTEPGGYSGYKAVFGSTNLDSELSTGGRITNLTGQVVEGETGSMPGFPGYTGLEPTNALAYTLDMQEHGIPVTYTYITDAHTNHTTGAGMGPGEAPYEQQLQAYNKAFTAFFHKLTAAGINKTNTLFVFGEDENDHYAGSPATNAPCTGVAKACVYTHLGEIDTNLQGLLAGQTGVTTPFKVHSDSAPFIYLTGQPARTSPTARTFGRALEKVTAYDTYQASNVPLTNYLADPVEMNVLHMVTADPARTPTFAMFANPDFYLSTGGTTCTTATCETIDSEVWNHGDVSPDVNRSWMAFVGPDVRHLGTTTLWASETDTRPTIMALLGLTDDYAHEGRVLAPIMQPWATPSSLASGTYEQLAEAYTSIEQPVGPFGLDTLIASTKAIGSGSASNDSLYQRTENRIADLGAHRDRVGASMIALLEGAAFRGQAIPNGRANALISQAQALLDQAQSLAG